MIKAIFTNKNCSKNILGNFNNLLNNKKTPHVILYIGRRAQNSQKQFYHEMCQSIQEL